MDKRILIKALPVTLLACYLSGCSTTVRPVNFAQASDNLNQSLASYYAFQKPLKTPMDMYYAMARAAKYNLDNRVKQAESVFYAENIGLTKTQMLPSLAASAGYVARNNDYGVFGRTGVDPSISQSRNRGLFDLQASWNLLDFGIGYINAKQDADRYLISIEQRRHMMQLIFRDVRYAYWRTVVFQTYNPKINHLNYEISRAVSKAKQSQAQKVQAPLVSLSYQEQLIKDVRDLSVLQKVLSSAQYELAGLMNYPNAEKIRVKNTLKVLPATLPRNFPTNVDVLEKTALMLRPEIREAVYNSRISLNEVHKARLSMLPSPAMQAGYNYDTNDFLLNNEWYNYGVNLTLELMNIFIAPHAIATAKAQLRVENVKQMAQAVAVITEVDLAYVNHKQAMRDFDIEQRLKNAQFRIYQQMKKLYEAKQANELELLQSKAAYILASLRAAIAYGNLQNATGILMQSVGYDPLPTLNMSLPLNVIQAQIKQTFEYVPNFAAVRSLAAASLPEVMVIDQNPKDKCEIHHIASLVDPNPESRRHKLRTHVNCKNPSHENKVPYAPSTHATKPVNSRFSWLRPSGFYKSNTINPPVPMVRTAKPINSRPANSGSPWLRPSGFGAKAKISNPTPTVSVPKPRNTSSSWLRPSGFGAKAKISNPAPIVSMPKPKNTSSSWLHPSGSGAKAKISNPAPTVSMPKPRNTSSSWLHPSGFGAKTKISNPTPNENMQWPNTPTKPRVITPLSNKGSNSVTKVAKHSSSSSVYPIKPASTMAKVATKTSHGVVNQQHPYGILAQSFENKQNAQQFQRLLAKSNIDSVISQTNPKSKNSPYSIIIGSYKNRQEAKYVANILEKDTGAPYQVVRRHPKSQLARNVHETTPTSSRHSTWF